jgi:hypothetical protein
LVDLHFNGTQEKVGEDLVLSATLNGRPILVRASTDLFLIYGLAAVRQRAADKAKHEKFELDGNLRVTPADFA